MSNVPAWERGWDKLIDTPKAIACLKEVADVFAEHEVTWWLVFGSLLGAVRDGGPIKGDDDIDIGVFQHERARIKQANKVLREKGFFVPELADGMVERDEVYIRDGQKIEAWVFHKDGDHYRYDPCVPNVRYHKKYFDNLIEVNFGGTLAYVPVFNKELVKIMYGDTWRTPQKGFKCLQF